MKEATRISRHESLTTRLLQLVSRSLRDLVHEPDLLNILIN